MAKYKAYPEYKDSGVEWLGEVPEQWLIKKLKYLCAVQTGSRDTVNAVEEGLYPFFVRSQTIERINSVGADCEAVLTAGDGVGVGKVYHYYNGKFDYHQRVYMLNKFKFITGRFVFYYLSSNFYKVALEGNAKSTVDSLRLPQFLNFEFSIPSIKEQNFITTFLDHETAKIDNLIEKQQQLIELLKEKRQAVISHAVTKGLNPDVPMKDSGVEWLGKVPEHWDVKNLNHVLEAIGDVDHYMPQSVDECIPYVMTGDLAELVSEIEFGNCKQVSRQDYLKLSKKIKTCKGDVIMARYATIGTVSYVDIDKEFLVSYSCVTIKPNISKVLGLYLYYYFKSNCFLQGIQYQVNTNTQGNVGINDLNKMKIVLPDITEQKIIITNLQEDLRKLDNLSKKSMQAINLMQERRTALISAAVTGKIDVRDWVAPNACEAEVSQEATA
ncbi:Type I restriction-modification system, specificity subunit S [Enterobacteriaceae bacterium bta3-1]|nr:Type I restriction-modification system, specificity subunit S [Enterobacteriaceae bacterium bta3-1]